MKPIVPLEKVIPWEGSNRIRSWLRENGYLGCEMRRSFLIEYCRANDVRDDLEKFWSETEKEFISSGSIEHHNWYRGSNILFNGFYRSVYLDQLALENSSTESSMLHPGLIKLAENYKVDRGFASGKNLDTIQCRKKEEFAAHGVVVDESANSKASAKSAMAHNAQRYGFIKSSTNWDERRTSGYKKVTKGGLEFFAFVDVVGGGGIVVHLPIYLSIRSKDPDVVDVFIQHTSMMCSGIEAYQYIAAIPDGVRVIHRNFEACPQAVTLGVDVLFGAFNQLCEYFQELGL